MKISAFILSLALMLSLSFAGCKKDHRGCDGPKDNAKCPVVVQDNENWESGKRSGEWISIKKAWIAGDKLKMSVAYSGCNKINDKDLSMAWDGYMKSKPAQVNMALHCSSAPQMCEAYFEHELCFTLDPIQLDGANELHINLNGYKDRLIYKY